MRRRAARRLGALATLAALCLGAALLVERSDSGHRLWGYRNGKLRFAAAADPALARDAGRLEAALREAGIR